MTPGSTLDKSERVPFVITYNQPLVPSHPLFANTFTSLFHPNVTITSLKLHLLQLSNLSGFLVRAKLHNRTQHKKPRGLYDAEKNCLTSKYISDGKTSYKFHSTGETRHITHRIDCNSKSVIYMIRCNHTHLPVSVGTWCKHHIVV